MTQAVTHGDTRAISIACDLIQLDPKLPAGKLIKSNLARALRKQVARLSASDRQQILTTTGYLLGLPFAPRELEDYGKLVKRFPPSEVQAMLASVVPTTPKAQHIVRLLSHRAP